MQISMRPATVISLLLFLIIPFGVYSQNPGCNWEATDAVGRKLPDCSTAGEPQKKFVGLFYWTWHTNFAHMQPCIPSEIIKQHPEAKYDYQHPAWPKNISSFFWGEPLFGFYRDTDRWVLRKHAEMLADAGVDVLVFDCTNGSFTWKESYMALCEVFAEARREGVNTPQIAFMLAFGPQEGSRQAIIEIYNDLYKPKIYQDLFFYWKGKPLIMAYPEMLGDVPGDPNQSALHREIRDYFTFRPGQPVYNVGPTRADHWGWLEVYPQHGFAPASSGQFEQATVGVAQNWTAGNGLSAMNMPGSFGRSYTKKSGAAQEATAVNWGLNFQEQWERALEIDPELIFITGWNEWIAGRFENWQGQDNAFPDQFDAENSRDIEPVKGGHGDNYYYQMVSNIRRFKGVAPLSPASPQTEIEMDGRFDDWTAVLPQYSSYKGNTRHRSFAGWGNLYYENKTGRNDIITAKVARDNKYIYFYVACAKPITPCTDKAWMQLFINVDRNQSTGWEGYDFVVNRTVSAQKATLEKSSSGWDWSVAGEVAYRVKGCEMEVRIAKKQLRLAGDDIDIEFKWVDNMQNEGDISDFWLYGDAAPAGRFNYRYSTKL